MAYDANGQTGWYDNQGVFHPSTNQQYTAGYDAHGNATQYDAAGNQIGAAQNPNQPQGGQGQGQTYGGNGNASQSYANQLAAYRAMMGQGGSVDLNSGPMNAARAYYTNPTTQAAMQALGMNPQMYVMGVGGAGPGAGGINTSNQANGTFAGANSGMPAGAYQSPDGSWSMPHGSTFANGQWTVPGQTATPTTAAPATGSGRGTLLSSVPRFGSNGAAPTVHPSPGWLNTTPPATGAGAPGTPGGGTTNPDLSPGGGYPGGGAISGAMASPGYNVPSIAHANPLDPASVTLAQEQNRQAAIDTLRQFQQGVGNSALSRNTEGLAAGVAANPVSTTDGQEALLEGQAHERAAAAQADSERQMRDQMAGQGTLQGGAAMQALAGQRMQAASALNQQLAGMAAAHRTQSQQERLAALAGSSNALGGLANIGGASAAKVADIYSGTQINNQAFQQALYQAMLGVGGGFGGSIPGMPAYGG